MDNEEAIAEALREIKDFFPLYIQDKVGRAANLKEVFAAYGFIWQGISLRFEYGRYLENMHVIFEALAKFTTEDSYYIFTGQDGKEWRFTFEKGVAQLWWATKGWRKA